MSQFTQTERSWQYSDDENALTVTDKLIGLQILVKTFGGETPDVCVVIPPVMIGSLIRALIGFVTVGSLAIAREDNSDR